MAIVLSQQQQIGWKEKLKFQDGERKTISIIFNKQKQDFTMLRDNERLWLSYDYNKGLTEELKKTLSGMTWHGFKAKPIKQWTCNYDEHNQFRLAFMVGWNPYSRFDQSPIKITTGHPFKAHQFDLASQWATTGAAIWAAEMGLGKSLAAIGAVEHLYNTGKLSKYDKVFWIAPKSALISVQLEYYKWGCKFPIEFMTYDGLKKYTYDIEHGTQPPKVLIGDESHKLKHLTTQRTQSFAHVAKCMRSEHGDGCYILLMTGTPAPKSPIDWYSQCEIVCPGYLREGNIHSFKDRLAVIKQKESCDGAGMFPELITWRDDTTKCSQCGKPADDFDHDPMSMEPHPFTPCVNEVELLYTRMKGLVVVKTKAECTDLPDKIYRRIYCKPKESTLRAMKMIAKTNTSAIKVLTALRELSDGFQYTDVENGKKTCELCSGTGRRLNYIYSGPVKTEVFLTTLLQSLENPEPQSENVRKYNQLKLNIEWAASPEDVIIDNNDFPQYFKDEVGDCPNCDGLGVVPNIVRSYKETATAKDRALIDILDEYEDVGRLVVYAGFKTSIDRIISIVKDYNWDYIRLDGRGWLSSLPDKPKDLIRKFQDKSHEGKIVFIGNPGSAGTGLTLTASPAICYYSNDFNADSRSQSEDRIHRLGMDENRGATIIDLIHLPTDEYVIENLQKKKRLQDMSLGQLMTVIESPLLRTDYE